VYSEEEYELFAEMFEHFDAFLNRKLTHNRQMLAQQGIGQQGTALASAQIFLLVYQSHLDAWKSLSLFFSTFLV
jgi:hypothetical protein